MRVFSSYSSYLVLAALIGSTFNVDAVDDSTNLRAGSRGGGRVLSEELTGTYLQGQIMFPPDDRRLQNGHPISQTQTIDAIELPDGTIYTLTGLSVKAASQAAGMSAGLPSSVAPEDVQDALSVKFDSGRTQITIPKGATMLDSKIDLAGQTPQSVNVILEQDVISWNPSGNRQLRNEPQQSPANHHHRKLTTGTRSVLAVRIAAPDSTTSFTEQQLSNSIFGNNVDTVNLRDQYLRCSANQLEFTKATGSLIGSDGVVTVEITQNVIGVDDQVLRNAVNIKLAQMFGVSSASQIADHIMHCIPPGSAGSWIGYAFVNSWNSIFNNQWCTYSSIQMHEVGHNIDLAHSGTIDNNGNLNEYDDRSCIMGSSYSQSDTQMCFNNAKNFQLGWFTDALQTVTSNSRFDGNIKGQINYQQGVSPQEPVIVRIDKSGSNDNYYVGFNHKAKYNANVVDNGNRVTIQRYTGSAYGQSYVEGALDAGQSWNNGKSGLERIEVTVRSLSTDPNTGRADISIVYGGCTSDALCSDGISCNGVETCGSDGVCVAGTTQTGCCGNDFCEVSSESYSTCESDCASRNIAYWDATSYAQNAGAFFKIQGKEDVVITKLNVHAYRSGECQFQVYTKSGDFVGSEDNSNAWTLLVDKSNVNCVGYNSETELPAFNDPVTISTGGVQSFLVYSSNGNQVYSNSGSPGTVNVENDQLKLYTGKRSWGAFGNVQAGGMQWNGRIIYGLSGPTGNPAPIPTNPPTPSPTRVPTKNPSKQPTDFPTKQPTDFPTKQPTNVPSKQPTNVPVNQPPTNQPTEFPTKQPTNVPTKQPTNVPVNQPTTNQPTDFPTKQPTNVPTKQPTNVPVNQPTTNQPTDFPTKQPTNVPSKQPTNVPINQPQPNEPPTSSDVTIKVDIVTDNFASETSWTLTDICSGGGQVGAGSGYSNSGQLYSTDLITRSSRYEFTINDSYGDGICCTQGSGSYTVHIDNASVASGGEFGTSETKVIGVDSCDGGPSPTAPRPTSKPTNIPTKIPTNSSPTDVTIKVEIKTDSYPSETSWTLTDVCPGGGQVAAGGDYSGTGQLYSTAYTTRSSRYEFLINDTFGDGICCSVGSGSYTVYMDNASVVSGGQFTLSESKSFGQCPANVGPSDVDIKVDIVTDSHPSETSWTLTDTCSGGGQVAAGSGYSDSGQLYSTDYATRISRFEFKILDAWGDGICCGQGSGSYTVYMDNTSVASGGDFAESETTDFGECPANVGPSDVTIKVDIQTDNFPSETSWTIMDTCSGGGQVGTGGDYSGSGQLYSTDYVTRSSQFVFIIIDTYGDGICCSSGSGSYTVFMDNTSVASGGGFLESETTVFGECAGGPQNGGS